tara:strand:+ start:179 stop:478 length:300 start_codon:yes stop_codon:yes gene_type:complete
MVEQTGEEIDWERCPPDEEDFPDSILTALNIYYSLGNRVYGDVGYVGKDFTNLPLLYDLYKVQEYQKDWIFELLLFLDNRAIEESQRRMKAEYDKIKRK